MARGSMGSPDGIATCPRASHSMAASHHMQSHKTDIWARKMLTKDT